MPFQKGHKPTNGFKKGFIPWNKGLKGLQEWQDISGLRHDNWLGKKRPDISGKNHYLWIENRNWLDEKHRLRATIEWKIWRGEVFERDKYICRECGISGVYLEPHHIIPIGNDKSKIFNLNNGVTLCRPCHQKTIRKEQNYVEKYIQLVAVQ